MGREEKIERWRKKEEIEKGGECDKELIQNRRNNTEEQTVLDMGKEWEGKNNIVLTTSISTKYYANIYYNYLNVLKDSYNLTCSLVTWPSPRLPFFSPLTITCWELMVLPLRPRHLLGICAIFSSLKHVWQQQPACQNWTVGQAAAQRFWTVDCNGDGRCRDAVVLGHGDLYCIVQTRSSY